MADFSKYTDMPLAAAAAEFAMEEYDPENPVMPECPFVTSFFQEGSFCDECYAKAYEAERLIDEVCSGAKKLNPPWRMSMLSEGVSEPLMQMAEYIAMKMFEAGWKAAKAEK